VLRREFDKLVEWTRRQPLPDVINLPNSLLISMAAPLGEAIGRPVCCTLQGEELFLNGLVEPYRSEALSLIRAQVRHVGRFLAVSDYCAGFMSGLLSIPRDRVSVVPLGINLAGYERRVGAPGAFSVGYFARIAPEKGLHLLADAYVRFRRRAPEAPARLEAAGYLASTHRGSLDDVRRVLEAAGLGGEFRYHGELDRAGKLSFLRGLDVLSVPATYDEPKGMFLLEAMASGVPVVQPRRGAFTEIVERTGGGVLVNPDDAESLASDLEALWRDEPKRTVLGERAFSGVREHYAVSRSAERLLRAYEAVVARAPAA
jgi:glycosyltransferase involved in cell wall biosynthesis